ncbi:MAG: Clp protease N-terminal domain-containing protein [Chloroflexota bacterium]
MEQAYSYAMQDPSQHDGVAVCSFCGRNASNARSLEAGAGGAYICNGCVARLYRSSTLGDFTEASSFDPLIGSPERFSGRARTVLALARQEARRFNHNYIGTEHLLLGLAAEGGGLAAISLSELGVDLTKIRTAVEFILGRGDGDALRDIGLTPRAKKVIELAADEAGRFSQPGIGTEHLLLGLIREGDGIACGILESLGVKLENARAAVLRVMKGTPVDRASDRSESDVPDFTNFTEASRKTLTRAQDEALRLNHNYIGTEHLLLGLAGEEQEVAMKVLRNLGVQGMKVRSSVEFLIGRVIA